MDKKRVNKIVHAYLKMDISHYGLKVKRIDERDVSTYDGHYGLLEIIYEKVDKHVLFDVEQKICKNIWRLTGLKNKRDFWIGVTSEL